MGQLCLLKQQAADLLPATSKWCPAGSKRASWEHRSRQAEPVSPLCHTCSGENQSAIFYIKGSRVTSECHQNHTEQH